MLELFKAFEPLILLGTILYTIHICFIGFLLISKRRDFWHAIVGDDGNLDPIDLVKLIWLVLFPVIILSDLFFNFTVEKIAWASLDAILFLVVFRDLGIEYINIEKFKRKEKNDKSE